MSTMTTTSTTGITPSKTLDLHSGMKIQIAHGNGMLLKGTIVGLKRTPPEVRVKYDEGPEAGTVSWVSTTAVSPQAHINTGMFCTYEDCQFALGELVKVQDANGFYQDGLISEIRRTEPRMLVYFASDEKLLWTDGPWVRKLSDRRFRNNPDLLTRPGGCRGLPRMNYGPSPASAVHPKISNATLGAPTQAPPPGLTIFPGAPPSLPVVGPGYGGQLGGSSSAVLPAMVLGQSQQEQGSSSMGHDAQRSFQGGFPVGAVVKASLEAGGPLHTAVVKKHWKGDTLLRFYGVPRQVGTGVTISDDHNLLQVWVGSASLRGLD